MRVYRTPIDGRRYRAELVARGVIRDFIPREHFTATLTLDAAAHAAARAHREQSVEEHEEDLSLGVVGQLQRTRRGAN